MTASVRKTKRGSILIFAIWTLTFLSVLAVTVGMTIRQRASLLARIENRSQLKFLTEAGVKRAMAALRLDFQRHGGIYNSAAKSYRHNNREKFSSILLNQGAYDVSYQYHDDHSGGELKRFGVTDEEGKININTAHKGAIKRLIHFVVTPDEDEAAKLAEAIVDWREIGRSNVLGFYSDEYYSNLRYPYESKDADFETLDELLLIRGFSRERFEKLLPYVTIWGSGFVNVNTASPQVLLALGLSAEVVDKILFSRRGLDGEEATFDDFIFRRSIDIASDVQRFVKLEVNEAKQIDFLNRLAILATDSKYYRIEAQARLNHKKDTFNAMAIYNLWDNKIEYWKEK